MNDQKMGSIHEWLSSNIKAETYDAAMFCKLIDVNLTGSFLVSQACARHMIGQGHQRIDHISLFYSRLQSLASSATVRL